MNWRETIEKYAQFQVQFKTDTKRTVGEKVQSEVDDIKYLLSQLTEIEKRNIEDITPELWWEEIFVKFKKNNRDYKKTQCDILIWKKYKSLVRCFVISRDNYRCHYCGRNGLDGIPLQVDHIVPKARNGGEGIDNLVCSCSFCNYAKQQYTEEEYSQVLLEVVQAVKSKYPDKFR